MATTGCIGRVVAVAFMLAAPQVQAGDNAPADGFAAEMVWFAQYAQGWCALGDARGCEIAGDAGALAATVAARAPSCAAGDRDACDAAWAARRAFWERYGRQPVEPDMMPGPNGEPPARAIWDQPAPVEPPETAACQAFIPRCGFFGDPALGR
ncbi:MAG: hypothetical protein H3C51_11430 [Rubellimicrobium sp.]|nr:hypothetical protein [Rubellimicrobium sp.]